MRPPRVGRTAFLLGFAGLLPQAAALSGIAWGGADWIAYAIVAAIAYAAVILSFLGGVWWGFALQRATGQARLVALAVLPSLWAFATVVGMLAAGKAGIYAESYYAWGATALAAALFATVLVDARLEATGEAPVGWTRLRSALSIGLGLLTLAAGWSHAALTRTEVFA